jgi:hypothetical protein
MKGFAKGEPRLVEKELEADLGEGNFIFVESAIDMFAGEIIVGWIHKVLEHCYKFKNTYLFQSKAPENMIGWTFPQDVILGTTLETDRCYSGISLAPEPFERACALKKVNCKKMVSIEPIMDFDLDEFVGMIDMVDPNFISIGADSKDHHLPEPSRDKVLALLDGLTKYEVKLKSNLKRILGDTLRQELPRGYAYE